MHQMSSPYFPMKEIDGHFYFPAPYSLDPMPLALQHGLIPVASLAVLSAGSTVILICFICYRLAHWKVHHHTFLGYNQYVLLVLNLLLADLQQSVAFLFTFHWIWIRRILAPTSPCTAQAWLLHSGDLSSGFFVLAIALHTLAAVDGKRVGYKTFAAAVLTIWVFSYFLTGIGYAIYGNKYFVRAGAWCWISSAYETERLGLHYAWVFLVQFGTVVIYVITFIILRRKTRALFRDMQHGRREPPNVQTLRTVNRIAKLMTLYPCVYVLLTLPLSAGRMWSYAHGGRAYGNAYACVAGGMLTSCGWVDTLLYTLTRRQLLRDTMPHDAAGRDDVRRYGRNRGITHTRSVTVQGTQMVDEKDSKAKTGDLAGAHELAIDRIIVQE